MNRKISEELEFEKNRMELLKHMNVDLSDKKVSNYKEGQSAAEALYTTDTQGKYAWEYEIEDYRKRKRQENFYFFGACCGILSFIITLIVNYDKIVAMIF